MSVKKCIRKLIIDEKSVQRVSVYSVVFIAKCVKFGDLLFDLFARECAAVTGNKRVARLDLE